MEAAIVTDIESLPKENPKTTEGQIRLINKKINALADEQEKDQLELKLAEVAGLGLSKELNELLKKNGLYLEALVLVLNYLTDTPHLAQYLYETPKDKLSEEGLEIIRRKLGQELEVLGGLKSKRVDVSKEWVKKLTQKAPSFCELSRFPVNEIDDVDFSEEERKIVDELMEISKSYERDSAFPPDKKLAKENAEKKKEQVEKLKESKRLMKEAQELASKALEENKAALDQKISELSNKLEMPLDWHKQDKVSPDDLLTQLRQEICNFEEDVVARQSYDSLEEVVAKASGGIALAGVYYSQYEPPVKAGLPILLPPSKVESKSAQTPYESVFTKFTKEGAAAHFAKEVESSGYNVAVNVGGHYGLFTAEAEIAHGSESSRTSSRKSSSTTTSASVCHHIRIGMQAFQIGRNEMKLRMDAREKALSVVDGHKTEEKKKYAARQFFKQYGSHVPCGTQNLGGIFFSIANAKSDKEMEISTLTHKTAQHLHSKVSFSYMGGVFGGGVSTTFDSHSERGRSEGDQKEDKEVSYTYSIKSIGPNADNQATFKKLLSKNNSTWAILDRGETTAYVPVWELLENLGNRFKESANVMRRTWDEDEGQKRTDNCKRELMEEYDRWVSKN